MKRYLLALLLAFVALTDADVDARDRRVPIAAAAGGAGIAFVQAATQVNIAASAATAAQVTINGTTAGNAIVCTAAIYHAGNTWTITSTTDGTNTYTTRQQADASTSIARSVIAYAVNIAGGTMTVSINLSGTTSFYAVLGCMEFSGVATSSPEVTFDGNQIVTSATDINAGPITTTDAGDLIIGVAEDSSSDTTLNFASPTSWINKYRQNDGNTYEGMDAGYWLPGSVQTTYTPQWAHDNTAGDLGSGLVVVLKKQ